MPGDSRNLWCLTEGEGDEPCSRAYAYGQKPGLVPSRTFTKRWLPSGNLLLHELEHHHRNSEFSHEQWWIFPSLFVYQRVMKIVFYPPVISGNFAAKRPPYPLMTGSETTSDAHQLRWIDGLLMEIFAAHHHFLKQHMPRKSEEIFIRQLWGRNDLQGSIISILKGCWNQEEIGTQTTGSFQHWGNGYPSSVVPQFAMGTEWWNGGISRQIICELSTSFLRGNPISTLYQILFPIWITWHVELLRRVPR